MAQSQTIRSDIHHLRASRLETLFAKTYLEQLKIVAMKRIFIEVVSWSCGTTDYGSTIVEHVIYFNSPLGHFCIKVSESLFEYLQPGDKIVVKYRRNHAGFFWGQIAR